uniref:calcyclin-binding protein-like n=1 Tax=Styela clava TaxID=7725 RepID=UPI00193A8505|nr:calcyclin-binding protein-like [Styela clava]
MEARLNELKLDLEDVIRLQSIAQRETIKGKLAIWKSEMEQELEKIMKQGSNTEDVQRQSNSSTKPKLFTKKITTYGWDQSEKFIKIYVSGLKGVQDIPKENVTIIYDGHHHMLMIKNLNNANHQLTLPKLLHSVENESVRIKKDEVVIMLKKTNPTKWDTLSEKEKKEIEEKVKPPSSFDKDQDPGKGIMDMMKKMYDEGDDDFKRTMAKAWTESRDNQIPGFGK